MAFLMMFPAITVLGMLVLMVIILILKFGSRCWLRHTTFSDQECWNEDEAYEQKVSFA